MVTDRNAGDRPPVLGIFMLTAFGRGVWLGVLIKVLSYCSVNRWDFGRGVWQYALLNYGFAIFIIQNDFIGLGTLSTLPIGHVEKARCYLLKNKRGFS